jgi:hypothetical protein
MHINGHFLEFEYLWQCEALQKYFFLVVGMKHMCNLSIYMYKNAFWVCNMVNHVLNNS